MVNQSKNRDLQIIFKKYLAAKAWAVHCLPLICHPRPPPVPSSSAVSLWLTVALIQANFLISTNCWELSMKYNKTTTMIIKINLSGEENAWDLLSTFTYRSSLSLSHGFSPVFILTAEPERSADIVGPQMSLRVDFHGRVYLKRADFPRWGGALLPGLRTGFPGSESPWDPGNSWPTACWNAGGTLFSP